MLKQHLDIEITDLSRGGAGVARAPTGQILFVPLTAPGDHVRVEIVGEKKRFLEAEVLEILKPSPDRVTPPCPVFGQCGGCQWQHLPYDLQWKTKASGVKHALSRVQAPADKALQNMEEFPGNPIWNYRNRIQLRGFQDEIGFYARRSHDGVAIAECKIARPEINAAIQETREEGKKLPRAYKVEIEVLASGEIRKTWNRPHGAQGFRQVHDEQNERMRQWIFKNLPKDLPLLDLYGGQGNLSELFYGHSPRIDCVDVSSNPESNKHDARTQLVFHSSKVRPWILRTRKQTKKDDLAAKVAILDPPRSGMADEGKDIVEAMNDLEVVTAIAVGCDPDSWARDLSTFSKEGWKIQKIALFDFFPHTPHVESVALLVRAP